MTDRQKIIEKFKISIDPNNEHIAQLEKDYISELESDSLLDSKKQMIKIWADISRISKLVATALEDKSEIRYQVAMAQWRNIIAQIENM